MKTKTQRLPASVCNEEKLTSRMTVRISPQQEKDLNSLGLIEKRKAAKMIRSCLATALNQWNKKYPGKSPLKSKEKAA